MTREEWEKYLKDKLERDAAASKAKKDEEASARARKIKLGTGEPKTKKGASKKGSSKKEASKKTSTDKNPPKKVISSDGTARPKGRPRKENPKKPYRSKEDRERASENSVINKEIRRREREERIAREGGNYTGKRREQYLRTMAKVAEDEAIRSNWHKKFDNYDESLVPLYESLTRAQFFLSKAKNARNPSTFKEYNELYEIEKAKADRMGGRAALPRGLKIALGKELAARGIAMKRSPARQLYHLVDSLLNHSIISIDSFERIKFLLTRRRVPKSVLNILMNMLDRVSDEEFDEEEFDYRSKELYELFKHLPERKNVEPILSGRRPKSTRKLPPIIWARINKR